MKIFFSPKRKRMISPRNDGDSISNENITTIVSKHREILSECLNTVNKISSKACSRKSYDVKNSPNKNKLLTNTNFFNKTKDIQESNNAENLEESKFEYSLKILRNRSIMDCNDSFSNNSSSSENEDESFNRLYKISTLQDGRNSKEIQLKGNLHKPKHFLNKFMVQISENLLVRMMYLQFLMNVQAGVLCSQSVGAFSCLGPGHMPRICTANGEREREVLEKYVCLTRCTDRPSVIDCQ